MLELSDKYDVYYANTLKKQSRTFFKQMLKIEHLIKEIKDIKKTQVEISELKNKVSTINSLYRLNSRMERFSELEERSIDIIQFELQREKLNFKNEQILRYLGDR